MSTFTHHGGFMPAGNDLHSAEMTLSEAQKMASEKPECLGFTFEGPPGEPPADAVLQVHFKSASEWNEGEGWHTFIKVVTAPPAPAPSPSPSPSPAVAKPSPGATWSAAKVASPPAPPSFLPKPNAPKIGVSPGSGKKSGADELAEKLKRRMSIEHGTVKGATMGGENGTPATITNVYSEFSEFNRKEINEMKKKFKQFDLSGDGFINFHELKLMMEKLGEPQVIFDILELLPDHTSTMCADSHRFERHLERN